MPFKELSSLLKKKGFRETFEILSSYKEYECERRAFYKQLNQFSYYNSFFCIKDELVNRGLIEIVKNNGKKAIKLTKKGTEVYNRLIEINDIINKN